MKGPMFIPLRREWFEAFRNGTKRIEWRAWNARWNDESAHPGRDVVLSLGYSGERLRGRVLSTMKIPRYQAPDGARSIYPDVEFFCAIHIELRSDGI